MAEPLPPAVQAVFEACSTDTQAGLHHLRGLILATAASLPAIGPVTEALRWGQPAYLTLATGAGSSLRIGPVPDGFALFVHCKTTLIATFLSGPGAGQRHDGTRAILFRSVADIQDAQIRMLIANALTYHLGKRRA
jgi:Domain of unknown function (DU1801)